MHFTRIRVPGEEALDVVKAVVGGDWRQAVES
jgi:hypothetical protein